MSYMTIIATKASALIAKGLLNLHTIYENYNSYIIEGKQQQTDSVCLMTTCALILLLVLIILYQQYKTLTFWSSRGIKTPRPLPIIGNGYSLMFKAKRDFDLEWPQKYGKVYGYYIGTTPRLVIADAEILRRICIKDFQYFPNHHFDSFRNKYQRNFLVQLLDLRWKRVRALMSPTFTSGKIKRMFKLMSLCCDDMIANVDENQNSVIDLKQLVSLYAMDVITTCCYALKLPRASHTEQSIKISNIEDKHQHNGKAARTGATPHTTRNAFVDVAHNITKSHLLRQLAMILVPTTLLKLVGFSSTPTKYFEALHKKASDVIRLRRQAGRKQHTEDFNDYLQLLLNTKFGAQMELTDMDAKENHHAGLTHQSIIMDQLSMERDVREGFIDEANVDQGNKAAGNQSKQATNGLSTKTIELSDLEIVSNVMFLLIVGYETTATLMSHFLYIVAHHQEIQEKLYQELVEITNDNNLYDYNSITSAVYLDAVISETLRFMSPVFTMDRLCSQDYYLEEFQMTIPKGTVLNLSYYAIMNDPDYWPEPRKFQPDRFLPENRQNIVPGSYCPFGLGPRHCIGYRFSLTEAKLGLARLLVKYRFDPAPNSLFPPEPKPAATFLNSHKNLNVITTLR